MPRISQCLRIASLLLSAVSLLSASEGAVAFDSADSSAAANGYPGQRGAGWQGRWEQREKGMHFQSANLMEDAVLGDTGKPYLQVKGVTEVADACAGAIVRKLARADDGPLSYSVRYELAFRVDVIENRFRYVLFDATTAQPATGKNVTWQVCAAGGTWRVMDGSGNGGQQNEINTMIPVEPQVAYNVVVEVRPKERKWNIRISNGRKTFTRDDLNFRSDVPSLGGYFHAGFSCADSISEVPFGFSIGGIKIKMLSEGM